MLLMTQTFTHAIAPPPLPGQLHEFPKSLAICEVWPRTNLCLISFSQFFSQTNVINYFISKNLREKREQIEFISCEQMNIEKNLDL